MYSELISAGKSIDKQLIIHSVFQSASLLHGCKIFTHRQRRLHECILYIRTSVVSCLNVMKVIQHPWLVCCSRRWRIQTALVRRRI